MGVIVYTTPTCGYCRQVKNYLGQRGVPFVEHDVSQDAQAAERMVRISGQRGVPVVVIDGQLVLGFNQPLIDSLLAQRSGRAPKLGMAIADSARIAAKKGIELPNGAYVGRVNPSSSAALAGLRPGDVIMQLAGRPIHTDHDVHRVMAELHYDETVELLVWRGGQTIGKRVRV